GALAGLDLLGDGLRLVDRDGVGLLGGLAGLGLELGAAGGRGVHADHLAEGVDQRAARVTRLDVRVGLDQPGQLLAVGAGPFVRRGDALVQGGDRARRDRRGTALAARVAQRGHGVAGLHAGGVAQVGGGEGGRVRQLVDRGHPAGGGPRAPPDRAGEDQPALVVSPRWRRRRAGITGPTGSGRIALPVLRPIFRTVRVIGLAHGCRPQLTAAVRLRLFRYVLRI